MKCLKCLKWWVHWGPWYGFTCVMSLRRSCLHWDSCGVGVLMGSDMHPAHALGLVLALLGNTFLGQVHLRQSCRQNLHEATGRGRLSFIARHMLHFCTGINCTARHDKGLAMGLLFVYYAHFLGLFSWVQTPIHAVEVGCYSLCNSYAQNLTECAFISNEFTRVHFHSAGAV